MKPTYILLWKIIFDFLKASAIGIVNTLKRL